MSELTRYEKLIAFCREGTIVLKFLIFSMIVMCMLYLMSFSLFRSIHNEMYPPKQPILNVD